MDEYPGNARKSPATPEKKIVKVVQGEVKRKKPPLNRRVLATFFRGHAHQTWSGVMVEVAVPAIKDLLADMVTQGVEGMIFGEARSRPRRARSIGGGSGYNGPQISYNRYASDRRPASPTTQKDVQNTTIEDVILETRPEAEQVLEQMYALLEEYNSVTVSELYEMLGLTAAFTHQKWGWTDLRGSEIVRQRTGDYLLALPRIEAL